MASRPASRPVLDQPSGNRLTADLTWPAERKPVKGVARVEATLFVQDPDSEEPRPGKVLARLRWPINGVEEAYPYRHDEPVVEAIPDPPPCRLWQEAAPLPDPGEPDRTVILALIERLRAAFVARKPEDALALLSYRYEDEARAENRPAERVRDAVLSQYRWMLGQKGEIVSHPLAAEEARLRKVAGGKVLLVDRRDGGDAVTLESPESELGFGIPVFVAKIGRAWTIVR